MTLLAILFQFLNTHQNINVLFFKYYIYPREYATFFCIRFYASSLQVYRHRRALKTRLIYTCMYRTVVCSCLIFVQVCVSEYV